jgi:hypothetical protein
MRWVVIDRPIPAPELRRANRRPEQFIPLFPGMHQEARRVNPVGTLSWFMVLLLPSVQILIEQG